VLNHILSLDSQLAAAHGFYQEFLCLISLSDQKLQVTMLKNWIQKAMASGIQELQSNARTFSQWFEAIASSFDHYEGHKLSNAFIEGINNKIKVIKRVSFGIAHSSISEKGFYLFVPAVKLLMVQKS